MTLALIFFAVIVGILAFNRVRDERWRIPPIRPLPEHDGMVDLNARSVLHVRGVIG